MGGGLLTKMCAVANFYRDYRELLFTATTLKIPEIVKNFSQKNWTDEDIDAYFENIAENSNLDIVQKTLNIYFKVSRVEQVGKDWEDWKK